MTWRWAACCAVVALVSLIPYATDIADINLPIWLRFALLPLAEGMHYMAVFSTSLGMPCATGCSGPLRCPFSTS